MRPSNKTTHVDVDNGITKSALHRPLFLNTDLDSIDLRVVIIKVEGEAVRDLSVGGQASSKTK